MRRIRSKDTQPEMVVRSMVHRLGYRYVLHDKRLPGCPDLVFPARRKIIFVHGCFWHGHSCRHGTRPRTNSEFWAEKIAGNQARHARHVRQLREAGWRVLVVWECSTHPSKSSTLQHRLTAFLEAG
jgi:DNA mismatch endonuclease, patch repair protein